MLMFYGDEDSTELGDTLNQKFFIAAKNGFTNKEIGELLDQRMRNSLIQFFFFIQLFLKKISHVILNCTNHTIKGCFSCIRYKRKNCVF